jgi:non-canonical purine NTP pyrophosphatase (RdgB/HAM1 family)
MQTLVFVTQNLYKLEDAQKLLPDFHIEHVDFEVPEIQSLDPREIVEHKLKLAYEKTQKPCFVKDASLFLDCLNGFPGPFIKFWFEKTVGEDKTCQIANLFQEYGCRWTTVLGYYDGVQTHFIEETVNGRIAESPRGANGYHWDTIFIPEGENRTFSEMTFEEKQNHAVTKKVFEQLERLVNNKS